MEYEMLPVASLESMKSNTDVMFRSAFCQIGCADRRWGGGNSGPYKGQFGAAVLNGAWESASSAGKKTHFGVFMLDPGGGGSGVGRLTRCYLQLPFSR